MYTHHFEKQLLTAVCNTKNAYYLLVVGWRIIQMKTCGSYRNQGCGKQETQI